jgi:hypothetical protein
VSIALGPDNGKIIAKNEILENVSRRQPPHFYRFNFAQRAKSWD